MKKLTLFLLCLWSCAIAQAQCRLDYSGWKLVLDESFNSNNLNDLKTRWLLDYSADPAMIGHGSEYYDPSQVSINNGICRLTATKVADHVVNDHHLRYKSGILHSKMVLDDYNRWGVNGFLYGMFEIRTKLPRGAAWPAFWLYSGPTEIDIIDDTKPDISRDLGMGAIDWAREPGASGVTDWAVVPGAPIYNKYDPQQFVMDRNYNAGDIVQKNNIVYQAQTNIKRMSYAIFPHKRHVDLSTDFHTYTGVWTPDKITYFFDGIEVVTISKNNIATHDGAVCIKANLQMKPIVNSDQPVPEDQEYYMDIDYIRVWKPQAWTPTTGGNYSIYNIPYKSNSAYMNHNVTAPQGMRQTSPAPNSLVSTNHNSIAPVPNGNEIFYKDDSNYPCVAKKVVSGATTTWTTRRIAFNDGAPVLATGDVKYLPGHDLFIYAGANNRVNLFGRSATEPSGFWHWYVSYNNSCYWCVGDDYISTEPGSLQTSNNGEIFYRGTDNKMHRYYNVNGNWVHQILPTGYGANELVKGEVTVESTNNANSVYYRGGDGRIQMFYKGGNGNYIHAWVENSTNSNFVSTFPGSMTFAPSLNGVFFIGTDYKIHLYYWNVNWIHQVLPYNYSAPTLGYANADLAFSGLSWDNANQRLYYQAFDGRIQAFEKSGSQWNHVWIDDYWNTDEFCSFNTTDNSATPYFSRFASSIAGPEGIYYTRRDRNLSYFKFENCEVLDPPLDYDMNLSRQANPENQPTGVTSVTLQEDDVLVYPNPSPNGIFSLSSKNSNCKIEVTDIMGKVVLKKKLDHSIDVLDLSQHASGVYFLVISRADRIIKKKIMIGQ